MIRVGEKLSLERKLRGLSIEEVAKGTRIRPQFLVALEKGDYKKLPSSAYIQGFIKNYADFLGLEKKEILAIFRREFNEREFLGVLPKSFTNPKQKIFAGIRIGQTTIYITIVALFILGFLFFQYRAVFFPPSLSVNTPKENATITAPTTLVSGNTDQNVVVTINDDPAQVGKDGAFKKDIIILAGSTEIVIKATNSFGKTAIVTRHVNVTLKPEILK